MEEVVVAEEKVNLDDEVLGGDHANRVNDEDEEGKQIQQQPSCFKKAELLNNHVNKISQKICKHPGFATSIDEQMKRFKG